MQQDRATRSSGPLSAVRRARAEALMQMLDTDGGLFLDELYEHDNLVAWQRAEIHAAIDHLAAENRVNVRAAGDGSVIVEPPEDLETAA